jgi:hypothetical protein
MTIVANMNRPCIFMVVVSMTMFLGCSDSKVVLQSQDGSRKLIYDPDHFRPQVETPQDIAILIRAAAETLTNAVADQSFVTVQEISSAMDADDWRRLEQVVVNYRASHKR